MSDDYRMRKDIDRFSLFLDNLETGLQQKYGTTELKEALSVFYDVSEVDAIADKLNSDLVTLRDDLTAFRNTLSDFSDELDDFSGDNERFNTLLGQFQTQLGTVLTDVTQLKSDAQDLQTGLTGLDGRLTTLNGTVTTLDGELITFGGRLDGFDTDLSTLDGKLTGFGNRLDGVDTDLTTLDGRLTTFGGRLDSFNIDLTTLSGNLDELDDSLELLVTYLVSFEGDLAQLEAKIKQDIGTAEYNKLNEDIVKLVGAITTVKQRTTVTEGNISTAQDDIEDIQDEIGSSTSTDPNTIHGLINNTKSEILDIQDEIGSSTSTDPNTIHGLINGTRTSISGIQDEIGSSTSTDPSTLHGLINGAKSNITDIQNEMGTSTSTDPNTIHGLINKVKTDVGDNNSGLIKDVNDLGGMIGNSSDTGTSTIYGCINTARSNITTIDNYLYGSGGSQQNPQQGSIFYQLNNIINTSIPDVLSDIDDMNIAMYGYRDGSSTHYSSSSAYGRIQDLLSRISDAETSIGTVDVETDDNLSNQSLWHKDALNQLLKMNKNGYTFVWRIFNEGQVPSGAYPHLEYCINQGFISTSNNGLDGGVTYEFWIASDAFVKTKRDNYGALRDHTYTFVKYGINWVGICYEMQFPYVFSEEEYDIIYEIKTNQFYKKSGNTWVVTTDVSDYFNNLQIAQDIVDLIYPVGAIYMSMSNVDPTNLFGGAWVQLQDTFLYATSGTADDKDTNNNDITTAPVGQGEATHTLTENEMPRHNHSLDNNGTVLSMNGNTSETTYGFGSGNLWTGEPKARTGIANKGGGQAHNNMPPYMKVYMWKRTA